MQNAVGGQGMGKNKTKPCTGSDGQHCTQILAGFITVIRLEWGDHTITLLDNRVTVKRIFVTMQHILVYRYNLLCIYIHKPI